jgi:uncharacterized protein YunC (DUF1805 family)
MTKVGDHILGVKAESTFGTAVAPDTRFEVLTENIKLKKEFIESKALKGNRRYLSTNGHVPSTSHVEGDIEIEVPSKGAGFWFKQLMGAVTTTTPAGATNARKHVFTADSALDGLSFTAEIQRTDVTGQAHRFVYAGCGIKDLELACKVGEIASIKMGVYGKTETVTAAAAQSASYPASSPLVFTGAALTVDGTSVPVKDFSLKMENGRKSDRYFLGDSSPNKMIEADLRNAEGKMTVEWSGLTQYNYFVNHTLNKQLIIKFSTQSTIETGVTGYLQVTIPAIAFLGDTPVGGGDIIEQSIDFKALDDGTNEPVQVEYVSLDTTV